MYRLKSIKLYFFSVLSLFFLSFRKFYFKSNYYNKKLITYIPERFFYNPSTYLSASLTTISNDFFKITNTAPDLLWKINTQNSVDLGILRDKNTELSNENSRFKSLQEKRAEEHSKALGEFNQATKSAEDTKQRLLQEKEDKKN